MSSNLKSTHSCITDSMQGVWKYPLYISQSQHPNQVFKNETSLKTHLHLNSESTMLYIMS